MDTFKDTTPDVYHKVVRKSQIETSTSPKKLSYKIRAFKMADNSQLDVKTV